MKFKHHKYTWANPYGNIRHNWSLVGPKGGINFHANVDPDNKYESSCGLEIHYRTPPDHMKNDAPGDVACWLIGGACWHDGTSLYAIEHLWPMIEGYLRGGEHERIFRILEREYCERFEPRCEESST